MTVSFETRMSELDALVAACAGHAPFDRGIVSDASNRTGRDWPWWGVQIEQSQTDGSLNRRVTAILTCHSTPSGDAGPFEARWIAQTWQASGIDTFHQEGVQAVEWSSPTPAQITTLMTALLNDAKSTIPGWTEPD